MEMFKGLGATTGKMILLRYGISILGTVLATAGLVTGDEFTVLQDGVTEIIGGVMAVSPVLYAIIKNRLSPTIAVKKISPELQRTVAADVASNKADEKARKPRTLQELLGWKK